MLRDIHRDGIDPVHLFPYRNMIFWGLVIYGVLQLLISALVAFLLLYKSKIKVLLGYLLGCLVWILYMVYFFKLWTVYWS